MKWSILVLFNLITIFTFIDAKEKNSEFFYKKYLNNPDDIENIKSLAIAYKNEKNYNKAIDFFKLCISKESDNSFYYHQLALCYKLKGRPDIAYDITTNALFYFENNFKLKLLCADILLDLGKISNSIYIYSNLLLLTEKKLDIAYIYGKLGKCYLQQNKFELSEKYLVESLRIKENSWNYYYLSKLYEERDIDKAIWAIKKAKSYSQNDDKLERKLFVERLAYLLYRKGILLKENGENQKAKEIFREFIAKAELKNTPYFEKANYWIKRL